MKPIVIERFADNGEFSHFEIINSDNGEIIIKDLSIVLEKEGKHDTINCEKCGGRTALVTGFFNDEPDSEPYNSGIEEESKVEDGECWTGGYKCDDCGLVQSLWHE